MPLSRSGLCGSLRWSKPPRNSGVNRKWAGAILVIAALVVALMSYRQGETDLTVYADTLPFYRKMPDSTTTVEFITGKDGMNDKEDSVSPAQR